MKNYQFATILSLFLVFTSLKAEDFIEKQKNIRTQKPISVHSGFNSVSNYYSIIYYGFSYNFNSNHEFGILLINSKFKENYDPLYLPTSQSIFKVEEFGSYNQNSAKIYYNYYLFDSFFFFNASIGYLPSISSGFTINSIFESTAIGTGYSYFSAEFKKMPTYYFSPGIGLKIYIDNGIFFSITGGPMLIHRNKTEVNFINFLTTNSTESNILSNFLLNLPAIKNSTNGFGRNVEAYVDLSAGVSF
ncbi:hypothetical protein [Leptospira meyeri]|uniref:hypothetical protein n=1 Tax=Leptospira meyeri TaxID=29508 RepID=UPI0002BE0472|nr:hypothetical protein [Leptospira meyeri]EMJ86965.1 hypothetical protein LEP1GSC196_2980 [Leptospira meyeri serovar Semaranga str. Veldrot Semarang 173]